MNELVERMRSILLQRTDAWKDASESDVIEVSITILDHVVTEPKSLFNMYSDQFDILEEIEYILSKKTLTLPAKMEEIKKQLEIWREYA